MRRLLTIAAAGLLLLASAGPAAANKPDREPAPTDSLSFPAGLVCAFDLTLDVVRSNQQLTTFYDRFGDPRAVAVTGHAALQATNEATGEEILIEGGGRVTLTGTEDSFVIESSGVNGFFYFPGDVTPIGVGDGGAFVIKGQSRQVLDLATNTITELEFSGAVIDVCGALE